MNGRKLHLVIVGLLTLITMSLSLLSEAPRVFNKAPEVALVLDLFGRSIIFTDHQLLWIKIAGIALVVSITVLVQYKQVYKPFLKFEDLRGAAFNNIFGPEIDKLHKNLTSELRFNIMRKTTYVRLSRYIHVGRLRQIYHYGFHHDDRDKSLRFWYVKLFGYEWGEGVSGTAFITEQVIIADLRSVTEDQSRLSRRKRELTREIELVMSFPVLRWTGYDYTCIGVINIDIRDAGVAAQLFSDPSLRRLEKLSQYFQDCTEYVSLWL